MPPAILKGSPAGSVGYANGSGWMDSEHFIKCDFGSLPKQDNLKMGPYRKGTKNTKKKNRRTSHNFQGNQHTAECSTSFTSSSAKKLASNQDFDVKCEDGFSYCILAFSFVFSALSDLVKCKICDKDVRFSKTGVRGLGFKINIACDCGDRTINSSPFINKSFEINRRMVFVMRLLGVGRNGLALFCSSQVTEVAEPPLTNPSFCLTESQSIINNLIDENVKEVNIDYNNKFTGRYSPNDRFFI